VSAIHVLIRAGGVSSRRALEVLHLTGRPIRARDLLAEPLSRDEIKLLAALAGGLRHIISTRAPAYRRLALARPDVMDPELLRLMLSEPDLIRRPIVLVDGIVLVGFEGEDTEPVPPAGVSP
jgi:arsenate reductase-like glutaredoxin family protein